MKVNNFTPNEENRNLKSQAYEKKIFHGKVITFIPPHIIFEKDKYYDIFFTKFDNENYCSNKDLKLKYYMTCWQQEKELRLNYETSNIYLNLIEPCSSKANVIHLMWNNCIINHSWMKATLGKRYLDFSKSDIKSVNEFFEIEDRYFTLEIKIKKPEEKVSISDGDDLKEVYYIILENIDDIIDIFSIAKYILYYEPCALKNYISKYVYDILNIFIKINNTSLNFFEEIGIINENSEEILYPLKNCVKKTRNLFFQGILMGYFKSDNRSILQYIDQTSVKKHPNVNIKKKKVKIEYANYLRYKVRMEDQMAYKKDFAIKKRFKDLYSTDKKTQEDNKFLVSRLNSEREFSIVNSNFFRNSNEINNDNEEGIVIIDTEIDNKFSENLKNFEENNTKIHSFYKKFPRKQYEFLKNLKIDKDGVIDVNSIFEYYFKILNKSFLIQEKTYEKKNSTSKRISQEIKEIEIIKTIDKPKSENKNNENVCNESGNKEHNQDNLRNKTNNNTDIFFINYLKTSIIKYITNKGFFNLDIVLNEEDFRNMARCCCWKNQKKGTSFIYRTANCILNLFNSVLDVNEGLIHKHFTIFSNSYNFNHENRIFTFNSKFDASKRNKLRIYDILFDEKWAESIAQLILELYKEFFDMGNNERNDENECAEESKINLSDVNQTSKTSNNITPRTIKSYTRFLEIFKKTVDKIFKDFIDNYLFVLPDYKNFCRSLARFPISRYNLIDNLCQHFTNSSIQTLLNKSIMFFQNNHEIKSINKKLDNIICFPNLDTSIEPFLISVDKKFAHYLNERIKIHDERNSLDDDHGFIDKLKKLNRKNFYLNNIILNKKFENIDEIIKMNWDEFFLNSEKKKYLTQNFYNIDSSEKKIYYDYYNLFNLSVFHSFNIEKNLADLIVHYGILKQKCNIINHRVSQNYSYDHEIEKNDFDYSYYIPRASCDVRKLRSEKKDEIMKNYMKLYKINKYMENISLMYYKYSIELAKEIYHQKKEKFLDNYAKDDLAQNNELILSKIPRNTNIDFENSKLNNFEYEEMKKNSINRRKNFLKDNNYKNLNNILNNGKNSYMIVKIGHLIMNCEKIVDNREINYKGRNDSNIGGENIYRKEISIKNNIEKVIIDKSNRNSNVDKNQKINTSSNKEIVLSMNKTINGEN